VAYEIVVCIKQVPDTANITTDAMKEDGTVNRAALPAIINPEDLNAVEMAVQVREDYGGSVTVLTMGPPSAAEALREVLYRGADRVILLTDRRFAAADTLATSYALCKAVQQVAAFDLVFCGRQAIDGDTAQIGPQLAEKLGVPQFTYVEQVVELKGKQITVRRALDRGYQIVTGPLPALLTVTGTANMPRPPAVKKLLKYRKARTPAEVEKEQAADASALQAKGLLIEQWDADRIQAEPQRCGGKGSPTKVKKIESVILVSEDHVKVEPTEEGLGELVRELISEHILE